MSWYRSNGVWKQPWEVSDEGAGFTDVVFSPVENERVNAFLDQYESREQRVKAFNGVGKRGRKERRI